MKHPRFVHSFEVVSKLPEPLEGLQRLAANLHWSWNHEARMLFRDIDRNLWEQVGHNPVEVLAQVSPERLRRLAEDDGYLAAVRASVDQLDKYLAAPTWYSRAHGAPPAGHVIAYFCAEFGLSEALPIYSGGLGVLAGDHLKAASDLGLPLVGVGLLYSRGYFRQTLSHDGWQQEHYPEYDFHKMPLQLVLGEDQQPLRIEVEVGERTIRCHIWKSQVGRIDLYLLDSNVLENAPADQGITDTLYGGDQEMRIRQEIILGVGGMRALQALGLTPVVCHMNEGHAAFLTLERIRQFMIAHQCDLRTARKVVVSSNVFTTHTPVPAGFDLFPSDLLCKYAAKLIEPLGIPFDDFERLGKLDPENEGEQFNMAVFAMENANYVNGVSKLHASVTRSMFQNRWPDYPEEEVPVGAVTNGIHTLTWISQPMGELFDQHLGQAWRERPADPESWKGVYDIPDDELWETHESLRAELVRYARRKLRLDLVRRGATQTELQEAETILDPRILTIGFARRFATYKRATLMLSDRERLKALLFHPERPIQIVIAGKSHPRDDGGKGLIQDLYRFIHQEGARARMLFLEDYDMRVARRLVQGVDVWLNNPRRPHEASGTSGMKVVPNGGLNCSVLDGWWDEGYNPSVGWAIGEPRELADATQQDWLDSHALYHLIETDIAPKFYHRMSGSVPKAWVQMMKHSIAQLAPRFSTARMVSDYAGSYYVPAWKAYEALTANELAPAKEAVAWRDRIRKDFSKVEIRSVEHDAGASNLVGSHCKVRASVYLNGFQPSEVRVQVVYGQVGSNRELVHNVVVDMRFAGSDGEGTQYEADIGMESAGHHGFSIRVVPSHPNIVIPAELNQVVWEGS